MDILTNALAAVDSAPPVKFFQTVWANETFTTATDYLVKGLIPTQGLTIIYGKSGGGKSFFTIDLAAHLAAGRAWRGRKVKKSVVIYVAAEAGRSSLKRAEALRKFKFSPEELENFCFMTESPNLLEAAEVSTFMAQLTLINETKPLDLVVIDTLSRAVAGKNENAPETMSAVVGVADKIRNEFGAGTLFVHHPGKSESAGSRGHSSLPAAADLILAISNGIATVEKSRDGIAGDQYPFSLDVVELGHDEDGEPITTCLVTADKPNHHPKFPRLTGVGLVAHQALSEVISLKGQRMPETSTIFAGAIAVDISDWRKQFEIRYGRDGDATRKAFQRGKEALLKANLIQLSDPYVYKK